ncbi:MAG: MlaD family protein [Deltaproteobacteria bacterium]|nr:MlaD family protein [Deltaproteobacteria bacterium]
MIQKIELKVGLFLIITSVMIAASIGYVAYKKDFFAKIHTFTLAAKSGEDLTEGMPVVFSGFKIGTVHALELSNDGSVLIKIKIPERHVKWIRTDSTFIVNKPLIGSARIVVVTDNLQSSILSSTQVPEVTNVSDINETIKQARPLLDKVNRIAGNVEIITATVAAPQGSVQKMLAHVEQLTGNLAQKKSLVEMAIGNQESLDALYASIKKTKDITAQVEGILQKADKMAAKTDAMLYGDEGTLPVVNKSLQDVLAKLQKLDTTVDNINKLSTDAAASTSDLKGLREQIDATVFSLNELVKEIEQKIPFKKAPEIKLP